ncbi:membrane protein [Spirochaetia bacterium]|nr:membrane protein [Spirochaetia bacterium]
MSGEDRKISFQSKESYVCPVCDKEFHREELLTGSGRLIAGRMTDELHRLYEPSAKYGEIFPLVYSATVCPQCWFASMDKDFREITPEIKHKLYEDWDNRIEETKAIFPGIDFEAPRGIWNGTASFYLVLRCYDAYPKQFSPAIKQGIAALRTGWMLDELDKKYKGQHFDWLSVLFRKKALFFYTEALRREQSGKETLSGLKIFGPDTDKNYGYEGALYITGILRLKYGQEKNQEERAEALGEIKRTIAKIFGLGKSSKNKPGPLLEQARNLYDSINKELNETDE